MLSDPYLFVVLAAACVSAVLGALSGFGGGVLVMPFLIPLVGVKGVVPVLAVAMFIANISRYWVFRKDVELGVALPMMATIAPGLVIGASIYAFLPERVVAALIGFILFGSIYLRRSLKGRRLELSRVATAGAGFGFGVLNGGAAGSGVIMVAILLGMGLSGPALVATDAVLGILAAIVKAAVFSSFDLLDLELALLGLLIGLATFPGALIARELVRRVSASVHVALIEAMTVVAGLIFVWKAFE